MERRKFIKNCCIGVAAVSATSLLLSSCEGLYHAKFARQGKQIKIAKSEFTKVKDGKSSERKFVIVKDTDFTFPICVFNTKESQYVASLLKCTHNSCELNVGGGIYTCPCHGSEFDTQGQVLEGPAETNLKTFKTSQDNDYIYLQLS